MNEDTASLPLAPQTRLLDRAMALMPAVAAVGLVLLSNAFTPVNTDLGWMLAYGRDAVDGGTLPGVDTYSFTSEGRELVMHEWATLVVFYLLHHTFGAAGLIAFKWLISAMTVATISVTVFRFSASATVRLVTLLLATHFLWPGLELIRAQLASLLLLACLVAALAARTRWSLWMCVPLMGVWANLHGGVLAGVGTLAVGCAAIALEGRLGWRQPPLRELELLLVPVTSLAAACLNPYGVGLLSHSLFQASAADRLLVREWLPLWRLGELLSVEWAALGALFGTGVLLLLARPRQSLVPWSLWAIAVASSLSASRHMRIAPILLVPAFAASLEQLRQRFYGGRADRLEGLVARVAAILAAGLLAIFFSRTPSALLFIDYQVPSPANAIAVMHANGLSGRIWNDYDWGGTLIWAAPESKVACDGRHAIAYASDTIQKSISFGLTAEDPLETVERFGADMALLPPSNLAVKRLSGRFMVLYCDQDACLLSRNPAHVELAKKGLRVPAEPLRTSDLFQNSSPWGS